MFGLSFLPVGPSRQTLGVALLGLWTISMASVGVGLNTGLAADTPAEADIGVEERVAEIDAESVEEQPDNPAVPDALEDPVLADVSVLPEPYATRLDNAVGSWTLSTARQGVRFGLTLADRVASVAFANQALLSTPGIRGMLTAAINAAVYVPLGYYVYKHVTWLRRLHHAR